MRNKAAIVFSILSVVLPMVSVGVFVKIEAEIAEAIAAGVLVGSLAGTLTGITALVLKGKKKNILVTVFSVLPIIPTSLFLILAVLYYCFG